MGKNHKNFSHKEEKLKVHILKLHKYPKMELMQDRYLRRMAAKWSAENPIRRSLDDLWIHEGPTILRYDLFKLFFIFVTFFQGQAAWLQKRRKWKHSYEKQSGILGSICRKCWYQKLLELSRIQGPSERAQQTRWQGVGGHLQLRSSQAVRHGS